MKTTQKTTRTQSSHQRMDVTLTRAREAWNATRLQASMADRRHQAEYDFLADSAADELTRLADYSRQLDQEDADRRLADPIVVALEEAMAD